MRDHEIAVYGDGRTKVHSFLNDFIQKFASHSERLYDKWNEYPFVYRERQLNALVFPALYEMKCDVFPELPFKKKDGDQRFLDYYIEYNDSVYLIELKHSYQSYKSGIDLNNRTKETWHKGIEQIDHLTKSTVNKYMVDGSDKENIYRMVLMVMPVYSKKKMGDLPAANEYAEDLYTEFNMKSKKSNANYIGVWKIAHYEERDHQFLDGQYYYPYVSFIVKVEKIWE